jgi:hypothetical protein
MAAKIGARNGAVVPFFFWCSILPKSVRQQVGKCLSISGDLWFVS